MYRLSKLDPTMPRAELADLRNLWGSGPLLDPWESAEVGAEFALFVWVAGTLERRKPVADVPRRLILSSFKTQIGAAAVAVEKALAEKAPEMPVFVLTIADNTLAGVHGAEGWLDLRSGEVRADLPRPPVEVVSYNLTALFVSLDQLYRQGELNAGRAKNPGRGG